jgi:hypothetical protein
VFVVILIGVIVIDVVLLLFAFGNFSSDWPGMALLCAFIIIVEYIGMAEPLLATVPVAMP